MNNEYQFNGYNELRYTPVPDEFFDFQMQTLTAAELRVLLYVFRRTFGFRKYQDRIAMSQFTDGICKKTGEKLDDGCGLSAGSVRAGIVGLIEKGYIDAQFYCPSCERSVEQDEMVEEIRSQKGTFYTVLIVPRDCPGCGTKLFGREQRWFSLVMRHGGGGSEEVTTGVVSRSLRGKSATYCGGSQLLTTQETVSRNSNQETEKQDSDPTGSSVCPDCLKPTSTSEESPKLKDVCACQGEAVLGAFLGDRNPPDPVPETEPWAETLSGRPWLGWSDGRFSPRANASVETQERVAHILEEVTTKRPTEKEWKLWSAECAAIYEAGRGDWDVIEAGIRAAWKRKARYRPRSITGFKGEVGNAWAERHAAIVEPPRSTVGQNLMARLPTA